jgi:hypothetical protein
MAKPTVYRMFEVHEGFGPTDVGPLRYESESRADADRVLEALSTEGSCVQLFGVRSEDAGDGERVRLRALVARQAA